MKLKSNLLAKCFSIILTLSISTTVNSQVKLEWEKHYNVGLVDMARAIAIDDSEDIYLTGIIYASHGYDLCTIKYKSSGDIYWESSFDLDSSGFHNGENSYDIKVDKNHNVYVTGSTLGAAGYKDFLTIKYDFNGNQKWYKTYNGTAGENDIAYQLEIDKQGNVYVSGISKGIGTAGDIVTIAYDSTGNEIWINRFYSSPNLDQDDFVEDMIIDNEGNLYLTGSANGYAFGSEIVTIKYNSSGTLIWLKRFQNNRFGNVGRCITLDKFDNVYVGGQSQGDLIAIKYNKLGTGLWIKIYDAYNGGNIDYDEALDCVVDQNLNLYITGTTIGETSDHDFLTLKINSSGFIDWVNKYNGTGNLIDVSSRIVIDTLGNSYISGKSSAYGFSGTEDFVTIKYDNSGAQSWIMRYNGMLTENRSDIPFDMVIDQMNNIYVTGYSQFGDSTGINFTTLKYSQLTGISFNGINNPSNYSLEQNYPNPFNPSTVIRYHLPRSGNISLKIYDAIGNEVKTLADEKQNAGSYSIEFNGSNLSSGVYFYKLESQNFSETKRMLLIK